MVFVCHHLCYVSLDDLADIILLHASLDLLLSKFLCVFFFFQAEDGIRDLTVTGVQTCALPIWRPTTSCRWATGSGTRWRPRTWATTRPSSTSWTPGRATASSTRPRWPGCCATPTSPRASSSACPRSEERRVGKECTSRAAPR